MTVEFLDAIDTAGLTLDDRHVLRDHVQELVGEALAGHVMDPPLIPIV